jgi:hypothetical protein
MSPAAIIERRVALEMFHEGLRPIIMFHEGLRSVGMLDVGPRPVVHDILPAADSRPGKA